MDNFINVSPLKILERSYRKKLGFGNLGVLLARAGVGKTACLIHIGFDTLFREKRLVHISLEDPPEKVIAYYNTIFYDLIKALDVENENELKMVYDKQ